MRRTNPTSTNALLLVVCLAQFMVILDVSVVNIALPSMRTGLHFSTTGLQWVVNAYTIAFAGFLMLGARSADLLGRRRVLLAGVALFVVSSLLCAVADSPDLLIAARAVQGFAGAIVSPATLSIITSALPEGAERNRGLGLWAALGGLGASSGALLGGILTQAFGWPAIFVINAPIAAVVIGYGLRVIPFDVRSDGPRRHFDVSGALLVTAGLVALTYGIVRTNALGWGSLGVLVPLAAAVVLIGAFAFVEGRVAEAPLVPLSIFKLSGLRAANGVVILMYAAMFSSFFFITLYLQQVLGDDAIQAGLSFLPMTLAVFSGSSLAPRLIPRIGVRGVVTGGLLLSAIGLLLFTDVRPGGSYFTLVLPGAVLSGLGMGLGLVGSTIGATQGVPKAQGGLASGLLNMSRLFGGAIGLAVLSTLATGYAHVGPGVSAGQALTDGFGLAFKVGAAFCVAGALLAVLQLRAPREDAVVDVVPAERELEDSEPLAA